MRRILYCTDSLIAGGTEQQLVELIRHLDRRRFEPVVLCLYGARAGRSLHFLPALRELGIPVIQLDLGWSLWDKLCGLVLIIAALWRLRPQIVQAVNYHSNFLLRLVRPFSPAFKLIGCVYVEYSPKQLLYERLSAWLCAAVVCNSPHLQKMFPKSQVIFNGIDLARFRCDSQDHIERVLLVMGRIARQKSPHLLVEALGYLKQCGQLPMDVIVWIVGEGEEAEAQHQLEESIRCYDLGNVVVQYPATEKPETYYCAADVTVVFSLWEGLPNVMLESLAAGRPVIVSEAANRAGVIRHGVNGWVVPTGDVEQLAETLHIVLALPRSELAQMQSACQVSVVQFSVAEMVRQYEVLYERLSALS